MRERVGIVGSGEIARGLAAVAGERGEVVLWARSAESAARVTGALGDAIGVRVETDLDALDASTFVIEAIVEQTEAKAGLLADLGARLDASAVLATTTSSLSVEALCAAAGRPERFVGLHVFNPVAKMRLVELAFPTAASEDTRRRAHALCEALDKTAIEVPPDLPGFVVNRLLFPFLFDAVRLLEDSRMEADRVDQCMKLGAGHPMGPLELLDLVGLDVAAAIGDTIEVEVPERVREMVRTGTLGRKTGRGFHTYG